MPLTLGSRLGPYEVVSKIGGGGMGEVFRARDTRLNRAVAIKVLPDTFRADPERLARFEREAQVLASLNHPNIAHVYGVEDAEVSEDGAGGTQGPVHCRALVMELVEGEDLAQRLRRGPLPLDEALPIANQIAHALEGAHEQGVIHRDLKPANIKLRADGTVKVLDFGLAKALESATAAGGAAAGSVTSPTMTSPAMLTARGLVLGTAAYMSPEQARGRPVDQRADIWAFGLVLYEMLTGRPTFATDNISDTIAAVLTREPVLDDLPPQTPPAVRRVLRGCLQKDVARRYHHIADVRLELEQTGGEPAVPSGTTPPRRRLRWVPALAVIVAAMALSAVFTWLVLSPQAKTPHRYSYTIPDAGFSTVSDSAISPDGRWIAYSPNVHAGPFRLFLRPLDGFENREIISGPDTGYNPFFSADGRWLLFFHKLSLFRVPIEGGAPERLGSVLPGTYQGAAADDGTIVVSMNFPIAGVVRRPLTRLTANRPFEALTTPGPGEAHHDPEVLPGGATVLFTIATTNSASIAAVPLTGGPPRVVLADARRPRYTAAARALVFARASSGDLMAVGFDPDRLTTSGEPVRLAAVAHVVNSPAFDVSRDGTVLYSGPSDTTVEADFTAVMVDRSGQAARLLAQTGSWAEPRLSPDGRTLVLRNIVSPNCDLWSVDLQRGTRTRVTFEGDNHNPIFRSDGQLTWGSALEGVRGIRMTRPDQPSRAAGLAAADHERVPESWSPDRKVLAFTETHPKTGQDIWLLTAETGATRGFATSVFKENQARFSPDGRWLAYVSDESGSDEVYIAPTEADGGRQQVSVNGGHSPLWSPDGRELFYVEKAALMVARVGLQQARPDVSPPEKLFDGPYVWERHGNYDITADGRGFVLVRRTPESDPSATLRVLVNWLTPR